MRIFLTGASGYLGSLLAERFAEMPEVTGITGIGLTAPKTALPDKTSFIRMDMRSPDLAAVMAGHDVVVHTACIVLWSRSMSVQERDDINLNGVRNVAKAALANKVSRFIHTSSLAAYDPMLARGKVNITEDFPIGKGDSPYYYWNSKAAAERVLSEVLGSAPLALTFFRPIYIIGPRNQPVVKSYRANAVNFIGHHPRRQFIHEEDVAAAFVLALRQEMPGAFNVVPDDYMQMEEAWKIVGKKIVPRIPLGLARWITGMRWRFLGSPVHPSWVEDILVDLVGSNVKLKRTGWKPQYGSKAALKAAVLD